MRQAETARKQFGVVIEPRADNYEEFVVVEIILHRPMPENAARHTLKQSGLPEADIEHRISLARQYFGDVESTHWRHYRGPGVSRE